MSTPNTQSKKKADEATIKRLAAARLKGLETRRMKAELKKVEQAEAKDALKKTYEEKVLKKTPQLKKAEDVAEETDKEIYNNQPTAESDNGSDSEADSEPVVVKPKSKATAKKPSMKPSNSIEETPMNYKQEYYRMKMMRLQEQDNHQQFVNNYARASPQTHLVDIAKSQLQSKVNKELMSRVYNDLFNC
jgi:Rps23 Pro-64 3,4-dihydroxylase Tpa1-like proline 4-hydroxylase